jgi:hypothetical protein
MRGSCQICQALSLLFLLASLIISEKEAEEEESMSMCECVQMNETFMSFHSLLFCVYIPKKNIRQLRLEGECVLPRKVCNERK